MKTAFLLVFIAVLVGCQAKPEVGENTSTEVRADRENKPIHNVYVEYKGPETAVRKFRGLFAVAADDHGLHLVESRSKADATVEVTIEEKVGPQPIYFKLLAARLSVVGGKSIALETCHSWGPASPSEEKTDIPGYADLDENFALEVKKEMPGIKRIYISPKQAGANSRLENGIRASLMLAGYVLSESPKDAEAVLDSVEIHSEPVPAVARENHITVKASAPVKPGYSYSSNERSSTFESVSKNIPERAKVCSEFISQVTIVPRRLDDFWETSRSVTNSLAK